MPTLPRIPIILVQNYDLDPPETTYYLHRNNEIHLHEAIKTIESLSTHPGRGKLKFSVDAETRQMVADTKPCRPAFLNLFNVALRYLLDYFSTFSAHDIPQMTHRWLLQIRTLQSAPASLPHAYNSVAYIACPHALSFSATYQQAMGLLNRVILNRKPTYAADVVHHWREIMAPHGESWFEGDFKVGLNAWQQFLLNRSPGFGVPTKARLYAESDGDEAPETEDMNAEDDCGEDEEFEAQRQSWKDEKMYLVSQRHVPMGALAIVQKHIERAIEKAREYSESRDDINEASFMNDFQTNLPHFLHLDYLICLPLNPKSNTERTMVLNTRPFHPSPLHPSAPRRSTDYFDPFCELDTSALTLWMLDEAVASYRGVAGVLHPANNPVALAQIQANNPGLFGSLGGNTGGRQVFRMMTVTEIRVEDEHLARRIRKQKRRVAREFGVETRMVDLEKLEGLGEVLGEMFEEWEL